MTNTTLRLNQIFTAKPINGVYHRGRVTEVQEDQTYAVTMIPFNEITERPTLLHDLIFKPTGYRLDTYITNRNQSWTISSRKPKSAEPSNPILINLYENLTWLGGQDTLYGKVLKIETDPETSLPLISVAINNNPLKIRCFLYDKNTWVRVNLNTIDNRYQKLLPLIHGKTTDADLAKRFRTEMAENFTKEWRKRMALDS
jgi:hypothetical protein